MSYNYAFIKDGIITNKVLFETLNEEIKSFFIEEYKIDNIILCDEIYEIGDTYENDKFCKKQPYPSWIKNEELNKWEPPSPMPENIPHKYVWNEDEASWVLAPVPAKTFQSWVFDSELYIWIPPIPYPTIEEGSDEQYIWNEDTTSWLLLPPSN